MDVCHSSVPERPPEPHALKPWSPSSGSGTFRRQTLAERGSFSEGVSTKALLGSESFLPPSLPEASSLLWLLFSHAQARAWNTEPGPQAETSE